MVQAATAHLNHNASSVIASRHRGILFETHRYAAGEEEAFPRHAHEEYQFYISMNTPSSYRYRGARHVVRPGSIFVLHSGEVHEPRSVGLRQTAQQFQLWYIAPEILRGLARALDLQTPAEPFFANPLITDVATVSRAIKLADTLHRAATSAEREDALLVTLERMITRFSDVRIKTERLCDTVAVSVRDYLHDHWNRNVSLIQLATEFGVSPSYLSRTFQRVFATRPHAYHTQIRIDRAKALLMAGRSPADVAALTGFYDQSHFTARFRRYVGVTPARYVAR